MAHPAFSKHDVMFRANASEKAKHAHETWFTKFRSDTPILEYDIFNYAAWILSIEDVCKKLGCMDVFQRAPYSGDKLAINDSKNVNLLMTHSMHTDSRNFMVQSNAYETYNCMQQFRPKSNEQRLNILKDVSYLDPLHISKYVLANLEISTQLIDIDPGRDHHDYKAPAHMIRLLYNLAVDQLTVNSPTLNG